MTKRVDWEKVHCRAEKPCSESTKWTRCHAIAKMTARCAQYMSALIISTKAVDDCARISTLQSYHYSAVKYSNKCDRGT